MPGLKKVHYVIIGIALLAVCAAVILVAGRTATAEIPLYGDTATELSDLTITMDPAEGIAELTDVSLKDGILSVTVRGIAPGNVLVQATGPDGTGVSAIFYVHRSGFVTTGTFFANSRGDIVVPIAAALYLLLLFAGALRRYRTSVRESLYQYRNVLYLGSMIFLAFCLLQMVLNIIRFSDIGTTVRSITGTAGLLATVTLPVAFIVSILITASNINLMRHEGRNWRNMLGAILGIMLLLGTITPEVMEYWLQWHAQAIDVHNMNGPALYVTSFIEESIYIIVAYLECVLLGTIICSVKAARHIPAFDKDYILILGCQIGKDGSLTKLLQGRTDRAIEFAKMQKEQTGKDIIYVPSGGQGSDEVMAEAEAVRRYLLAQGIPEEQILAEDKSVSTYENFRNSYAMIKDKESQSPQAESDSAEAKIAFSTTNYHVFRSGMLAHMQGIAAEGIGSPTKRYFWINAFVREFIAAIAAEKKRHAVIILLLLAAAAAMTVMLYYDNNL